MQWIYVVILKVLWCIVGGRGMKGFFKNHLVSLNNYLIDLFITTIKSELPNDVLYAILTYLFWPLYSNKTRVMQILPKVDGKSLNITYRACQV